MPHPHGLWGKQAPGRSKAHGHQHYFRQQHRPLMSTLPPVGLDNKHTQPLLQQETKVPGCIRDPMLHLGLWRQHEPQTRIWPAVAAPPSLFSSLSSFNSIWMKLFELGPRHRPGIFAMWEKKVGIWQVQSQLGIWREIKATVNNLVKTVSQNL